MRAARVDCMAQAMNFESRETGIDPKLLKGNEANGQRAGAVTPEMLEAFLRQNPPRHVPRAIYRRATADSLLFIMLLGFIFFVQGLVMAWIFFPRRLPDDARISARGAVGTGVVLNSPFRFIHIGPIKFISPHQIPCGRSRRRVAKKKILQTRAQKTANATSSNHRGWLTGDFCADLFGAMGAEGWVRPSSANMPSL